MKIVLRLFFFSLLFISLSLKCISQNTSVSLGSWREHIPYNKAVEVAEDNNGLVYCASQFGLFTYSKNDQELNTLSRLKELSDQEIATIRFDHTNNVLLIAYQNSNIDIIYPDKNVVNLPDIKQKNIIGGKTINSIFFLNNKAYLSCGFGIVVVDLDRKEIKDTYYIGHDGTNINVNGLAYDGTYLMAATDSGIYKANYNDPNIFNYTSWTKDLSLTEPDARYSSVTNFNGKFYTVKTSPDYDKDTVLVYSNNQWSQFIADVNEGGYVDSYNNNLIYNNVNMIGIYDASGNKIRSVDIYTYSGSSIKHGFTDGSGNFWIADYNKGLVLQRPGGALEIICPNGPRSEAAWALGSKNGRVWVATGSISGDSPIYDEKNGVFFFSDNSWKSFDCSNDGIYGQLCATGSPAVICVAVDPSDADHAFIGSWGNGLLEYRQNGGVNRYTEANSALHAVTNYPGYVRVGGVSFDESGNLWAVAGANTNGIAVLKKDGSWQSFIIPEVAVAGYGLYELTIDDYGQKWFIAREGSSTGQGLCVFKEANLNNPGNASFRRLTDRAGAGSLPDMYVRSIAKDKDGSIWIGTNTGVAVIYNPGNVFGGGNYDAQKIIIQQDGYNQYLLETESVNAIAIDGANRKWFGTYSGGVFLMSADGTKQILNFNKDNSPLPSNFIYSIAIDDVTGEVFFATDKGIISYRGDATEGGETCSDYYVFPNPVRHEYHGPIAIRGLVANADVKIADVAGNVVYHTKANGGEAIWNGNNFKGERAQTGVYIVYVTNEDGSQTCTTKMIFAN